MSAEVQNTFSTIWLAQYIETTRSRYHQAAAEHQRNALRLEGAALALRELADAQDALRHDSTVATEDAPVVGQQ